MELLAETLAAYPLSSWLLALFAIFAATCIQFSLGIAFGLIAGPALALIHVDFVPAPVLMLTCVTATTGAVREWRLVRWDQVRWSVSGRFLGALVAIYCLALIPDEKTFLLVFGLLIGFAVLLSVSGLRFPFTLPTIGAAGMVSGFTATITGVGGPPMAVVFQHQKAIDARPTLQSFFALGSLASFLLLMVSGHVGARAIAIALLLVPGFVAGYFVAPHVRGWFD
ncbi:MAG: sulfite exporter TauE/SafE family protein, partial [Nitratireductor sp.]|nr:sulfite exporter TauE/SafE family protein [Nitratireductor sp.]